MFSEVLLLARWQAHKLADRGCYRLADPCTQAFTFRGPRYGHPSNYARVVFQCMPAERLSLEVQASWPVAVSAEEQRGVEAVIGVALVDSLISSGNVRTQGIYPYRGCAVCLIEAGWDDVMSSEAAFYMATSEAQGDVDQSQFQGKPGFFGETWVSWAELAGIDWDEQAEAPDSRVHTYVRDKRGRLRYTGKALYSRDLARELGLSIAEVLARPPVFAEGTEWDINGTIYRVETLTRRQALAQTRDWPVLFSLMRTLAERFGEGSVRLVVWFD